MYLLYGLLGGISGGIICFVSRDVFNIYIFKTQRYTTPYKDITQFLNIGFIFGATLGFFRAYLGVPIIDYLIPKLN